MPCNWEIVPCLPVQGHGVLLRRLLPCLKDFPLEIHQDVHHDKCRMYRAVYKPQVMSLQHWLKWDLCSATLLGCSASALCKTGGAEERWNRSRNRCLVYSVLMIYFREARERKGSQKKSNVTIFLPSMSIIISVTWVICWYLRAWSPQGQHSSSSSLVS